VPLLHRGPRRLQRRRRWRTGRARALVDSGRPRCPESSGRAVASYLPRNEGSRSSRPLLRRRLAFLIFLKPQATTAQVGWPRSPTRTVRRGAWRDRSRPRPHVAGRTRVRSNESVWDSSRATPANPGSVIQKESAGSRTRCSISGKALGVPVYELFGGPTRDDVRRLLVPCGTTRARAWEVRTPRSSPRMTRPQARAEVVERGFPAFKTNIVIPATSRRC